MGMMACKGERVNLGTFLLVGILGSRLGRARNRVPGFLAISEMVGELLGSYWGALSVIAWGQFVGCKLCRVSKVPGNLMIPMGVAGHPLGPPGEPANLWQLLTPGLEGPGESGAGAVCSQAEHHCAKTFDGATFYKLLGKS